MTTTVANFTLCVSGEIEVDGKVTEEQIRRYLIQEADDIMARAGRNDVGIEIYIDYYND